MDDDLLGEGGGAHGLVRERTVRHAQPAATIDREFRLTEVRIAAQTEEAAAARAKQADHNAVARAPSSHTGPDLFDDARRLVAGDRGKVPAPGTFREVDVAVADRARRHSHPHLPRLGRVEPKLLDLERSAEGPTDRRLHGASSGG